MKKIIPVDFDASTWEEGDPPDIMQVRIIDWHPEVTKWMEWKEVNRREDDSPTYVATEVQRAGIFSHIVKKYTPIKYVHIEERRDLVRMWTDEDTGERMVETLGSEYRTITA
jgi:hypothetical protein